MEKRARILLLIPRLRAGGAEQVMALLAGRLSQEKYEVHLGLITARDTAATKLPSWVTVHSLGARRTRWAALRLMRLVWLLRPPVILTGAAQISFLVLLLRPFLPSRTRVLLRQNGTASYALKYSRVPRYTRLLYRLLYRHADRVICQSRAMAEDLMREAEIDAEQIAVLPNPVDLEAIRDARNAPIHWAGAGPHLLSVGRLEYEKGVDLLLAALANVRKRFPEADLVLAGAGSEEMALKQLCARLHLETAVHFAGRVDCPYVFFPGASLFVLSSRYEGMPNALLEAAAAGLPLLATPASGGVIDLLRGRPGAWLAVETNATALETKLIEALEVIEPAQRFAHGFLSTSCKISEHIAGGEKVPLREELWIG
jgi:glycosyltransferase involved in cell wall biosynthesis